MGVAFGPTADFSALAPGFSVNVVEHKTVVEVDETGTVAAAATGIGVTTAQPQPFFIAMDHPFFYAIRDDKTGALLFIGILMPAMRAIVSTLSLLVALVAADHVDHAPTAHDLAVLADLFNGWTYFHEDYLPKILGISARLGSAARP